MCLCRLLVEECVVLATAGVSTRKWASGRVQLKCNGTRWRTEGEVKGKLAKGVGSQYSSHYLGTSSITTADARTSALGSRLNWRPRRFKWTRPFRRTTKSVFCACHHISNAIYWDRTCMLWRGNIRWFTLIPKSFYVTSLFRVTSIFCHVLPLFCLTSERSGWVRYANTISEPTGSDRLYLLDKIKTLY
jgi:hypothetical protein